MNCDKKKNGKGGEQMRKGGDERWNDQKRDNSEREEKIKSEKREKCRKSKKRKKWEFEEVEDERGEIECLEEINRLRGKKIKERERVLE